MAGGHVSRGEPSADRNGTVLLVGAEPRIREAVHSSLASRFIVEEVCDRHQALNAVEHRRFDCVLVDIRTAEDDAGEQLSTIRHLSKRIPVMAICSAKEISFGVEAVRAGAADFLIKELETAQVSERIRRTLKRTQRAPEPVAPLKHVAPLPSRGGGKAQLPERVVIGGSQRMLEVMKLARRVAVFPVSVLLLGESGTGKELFARWIHRMSSRSVGPFVGVNLAAIPSDLVESALFGHAKGAFTGAVGQRTGKFGQAKGGTLLLDEITELKLELQPKLLRVLQENEYELVGGERTIENDARIIAATNQDIVDLVQRGAFRRDLYYRLNVVTITLPPLRERREDIPDLAKLFFAKYNRLYSRSIRGVDAETMKALVDYTWPGNVRELENTIQRAVISADGEYATYEDLFDAQAPGHDSLIEEVADQGGTLEDLERRYIEEILRHRTHGHQGQAAKILGIDRKTLYNKIMKYGLARCLHQKEGRGREAGRGQCVRKAQGSGA